MTRLTQIPTVTPSGRAEASVFVRKLRHGADLTGAEEAVLNRFATETFTAERGDVLQEGTEPHSILLVLRGWACRYKQLENGKRQITSLYLPGDLCEPFGAYPAVMDHAFAALTPALLSRAPPRELRAAARNSAAVEKALWWDLLMAEAIGREHSASLGRRSATERLGHFFCELHVRLGLVGMCDGSTFEFRLTQVDLADLFGLSPVHVNRSLQELRGSGLLSLRERRITLHDVNALREVSMFDPSYLRPNSPWTA